MADEGDAPQDPCAMSPEDLENMKQHWEERLSSEPVENLFPKQPESKPAGPEIDLDQITDNVDTESTDVALRQQQWEQALQESQNPTDTPEKEPFPRDENGEQDVTAIEAEIAMDEEREAQLKRERGSIVDADQNTETETPPVVTYNEMTEADRGSQLDIQHNIILQDIEEQKRREEEVKEDKRRASQQLLQAEVEVAKEQEAPISEDKEEDSKMAEENEQEEKRRCSETTENLERRNSETNSYPDVTIIPLEAARVESAPETEVVQVDIIARKSSNSSQHSLSSHSPQPSPLLSPLLSPQWSKDSPFIASFEQRHSSNVVIRDMQDYQDRLREMAEQRRKLGQVSANEFSEGTIRPSSATPDLYQNDTRSYKGFSMEYSRSLSNDSADLEENERINLQPKTESIIERERRLVREREEEHRRAKGLQAKDEPKYVDLEVNIDTKSELPRRTERSGSRTLASNQLKSEIKRQTRREMDLKKEGKIRTTSEEHVDVPYSGSGDMRKQLTLGGLLDGAEGDKVDGLVRHGSVDGERRKSNNPQQSIIEKEIKEMKARENELKAKHVVVAPTTAD